MKRIIAGLLSAVLAVSMVACGQPEAVKTEIITSETVINAVKMDVPIELQGYKDVHPMSYDGQYAVFRINRQRMIAKDFYQDETARIVVYDTVNKRADHVVNLDFPFGRVGSAVKNEDKLYFTVYYTDDSKEEVYVNDGLETRKIADFEMNTTADFSRLKKTEDLFVLTYNNGTFDNYDYHFYLIKDENLEKTGEFKQKKQGFAEITGYKDGKLIINETEINDDGYIYFNKWTGDEKETVFKLNGEHSHSFRHIGDMFIHPVDNPENNGQYKMMAVTDLKNGGVTEIGMMQGGFFDSCENRGLMYTYGKSEEQILLFEAGEGTLTITAVDIDVKDKNSHSYYMAENAAFLEISNLYFEDMETYKDEAQWYLIEY